jgi:hypothetical protein
MSVILSSTECYDKITYYLAEISPIELLTSLKMITLRY